MWGGLDTNTVEPQHLWAFLSSFSIEQGDACKHDEKTQEYAAKAKMHIATSGFLSRCRCRLKDSCQGGAAGTKVVHANVSPPLACQATLL